MDVNVRNVQTFFMGFHGFIGAKLAVARKQNLKDDAQENGSFAGYFIHQNKRRNREGGGYVKSTGDRLERREEAKQGEVLRLDKE